MSFNLIVFYRYDYPNTLSNKQIIVHLFEWKWLDIAKECEDFLQYYGYGAIQVSPPMEHITLSKNNDMPWWVRYQPVSYKLESRSGNETQFIEMVERCNKVGIRIIVDVVFNHMTGIGMKQGSDGVSSSSGSYFDSTPDVQNYPAAGYDKIHFNNRRCNRSIKEYEYRTSVESVKNCRLKGLLDLNQANEHVRSVIVDYLDHLLNIGVAGFRIDASKHMWPGDLEIILKRTKNIKNNIYGPNKRPFAVHEVIDLGGEAIRCDEYITIGRYTDMNYGKIIAQAARRQMDWSDLVQFGAGYGYGNLASHDVLVFIDNHDNQRELNPYVLNYKERDQYALCVGFMLAWNYGLPRIMSSYVFETLDQGPPNYGQSRNYETKSPIIKSDKSCKWKSGWVCEHRWQAIRAMTLFRMAAYDSNTSDFTVDKHRLAFARTGKGYFALNNGDNIWQITVDTKLPPGDYCDVWSGELELNQCTGKTITVDHDGLISFFLNYLLIIFRFIWLFQLNLLTYP
ncbi:unnamed protein product [Dracunculus medinensis]|uniref:Alpha-amylase n=1 Tax=Dracunculus medinensis TaxID=318479 RepID=A0A0N4UIR3_DRAME|nr:unnamed protein product [Dracunculus medinensis]